MGNSVSWSVMAITLFCGGCIGRSAPSLSTLPDRGAGLVPRTVITLSEAPPVKKDESGLWFGLEPGERQKTTGHHHDHE